MRLIAEEITQVEFLSEEKDGKRSHFIEGIFLQAELQNKNGRKYPLNTLQREVAKYDENHIRKGRALGELGHPDGPSINLDRVSHKIVELQPEGKNFIGKAKLLETPMGKIAKNLLEEGVQLGVSSRGLGSLRKEGTTSIVADDFILSTAADIVADPSAPDAFVQGIYEGKEWALVDGAIKEAQLEAVKEILDNAPSKEELAERKISAFESLLRSL